MPIISKRMVVRLGQRDREPETGVPVVKYVVEVVEVFRVTRVDERGEQALGDHPSFPIAQQAAIDDYGVEIPNGDWIEEREEDDLD